MEGLRADWKYRTNGGSLGEFDRDVDPIKTSEQVRHIPARADPA